MRGLDFRFNVGSQKIGAPFHGLKAFFTTPQLALLDKVRTPGPAQRSAALQAAGCMCGAVLQPNRLCIAHHSTAVARIDQRSQPAAPL